MGVGVYPGGSHWSYGTWDDFRFNLVGVPGTEAFIGQASDEGEITEAECKAMLPALEALDWGPRGVLDGHAAPGEVLAQFIESVRAGARDGGVSWG